MSIRLSCFSPLLLCGVVSVSLSPHVRLGRLASDLRFGFTAVCSYIPSPLPSPLSPLPLSFLSPPLHLTLPSLSPLPLSLLSPLSPPHLLRMSMQCQNNSRAGGMAKLWSLIAPTSTVEKHEWKIASSLNQIVTANLCHRVYS